MWMVLVAACLFCGCKKEQVQTENAALAMYERYADNSHGVTVAYLGDFKVDNQPINAVMLSAPSEAEWQWLCDEFGVRECKNSPDAMLKHLSDSIRNALGVQDTAKNVTHTNAVYIQGNLNLMDDTAEAAAMVKKLLDKDSVAQQEAAEQLVEQVVGKLLGQSGLKLQNGKKVSTYKQVRVSHMDSIPANIDSLVRTHARRSNITVSDVEDDAINIDSIYNLQRRQLQNYAKNNGYQGNVIAVNYEKKTLWLFFYRNSAEFDAIMRHINRDVIPL